MRRSRFPNMYTLMRPGPSIISFPRINTILPHSIPFLLGRSRAEKAVILGSNFFVIFAYENGVFGDGNIKASIFRLLIRFLFSVLRVGRLGPDSARRQRRERVPPGATKGSSGGCALTGSAQKSRLKFLYAEEINVQA